MTPSISSAPVPSTANHGLPSQGVAGAFKAKIDVVAPETHSMSETDKKKLSSQLANLHGQATKVYVGQRSQTETITESALKATDTLFFKDCIDCVYTLDTTCTKLIIEKCTNLTVNLVSPQCRILTHILEAWSCKGLSINAAIDIKTYQIDLSEDVRIEVDDRAHFQQLIWASTESIHVRFKGCGSEFRSGVREMQEVNPTVRKDFDQFILRFVKNKLTGKSDLLNELVVRLENGFPTTEREARQFEERQEENLQLLARKMLGENIVIGPSKRETVKVGRNDKCICGSTKKYKACCGNKMY